MKLHEMQRAITTNSILGQYQSDPYRPAGSMREPALPGLATRGGL